MTFKETIDTINANIKKEKNKNKNKAILNYKLAECIGYNVAHVINSDNKVPAIEEIYSFLFADEIEQIKEVKVMRDIAMHKENFKAFADRHNKQRKEVEQSDTRRVKSRY